MILFSFFKCLRPKQWTKNLLLFAGIIFAQRWDQAEAWTHVLAGFFIFCFLSGFVYICNDVIDREKDREHPKKKFRPIASGAISPQLAVGGASALLIGALIGAWLLTVEFFVASVLYVVLVTLYSFKVKHMVVLDIMVLALGFVLRAIAGIEVLPKTDVPVEITPYFLSTTLFLALFLAIAKRRNELVILADGAKGHRKVLEDYSTEFLNVLLTVATTGVIFSYTQWSVSGDFAKIEGAYAMAFTLPFVLYGIFRYLWLVFRRDEGGAPETLLLTDKPLLITVLLWIVVIMIILSQGS